MDQQRLLLCHAVEDDQSQGIEIVKKIRDASFACKLYNKTQVFLHACHTRYVSNWLINDAMQLFKGAYYNNKT